MGAGRVNCVCCRLCTHILGPVAHEYCGLAKGFMVVSGLYLASSTFTVAKIVRDQHETELMDRASHADLKTKPTGIQ